MAKNVLSQIVQKSCMPLPLVNYGPEKCRYLQVSLDPLGWHQKHIWHFDASPFVLGVANKKNWERGGQ